MSSGDAHALGGHHLSDAVLRLLETSVGPYGCLRALGGDPLRHGGEGVRREVGVGSPPASEITSGRAVTAIRSRIAEDFGDLHRDANSRRSARCPGGAHGLRGRGGNLTQRRVPTLSAAHEPLPRHRNRYRPSLGHGDPPYLPPLLAGGLARSDIGIDFDGTDLWWLESPAFLAGVVALGVIAFFVERSAANAPRRS